MTHRVPPSKPVSFHLLFNLAAHYEFFLLFLIADMISEEVMKLFTNVAAFFGQEFDIEMVDGGTCEVCVACEEDYMVAMAYIADCHTFRREVCLEKFNVDLERNRMIDMYLNLLNFHE